MAPWFSNRIGPPERCPQMANTAGMAKITRQRPFKTNPAGAAIVNAVGPIRQVVRDSSDSQHRYLVIAEGTSSQPGSPVQIQTP